MSRCASRQLEPHHLVSHLILKPEVRKTSLTWSPVTESNRRPSPYHACRFRLMPSGWVGLPQARGIPLSGYVALGLPLPGALVTWFVTGSRPLRSKYKIVGPAEPWERGRIILPRPTIPVPERESANGLGPADRHGDDGRSRTFPGGIRCSVWNSSWPWVWRCWCAASGRAASGSPACVAACLRRAAGVRARAARGSPAAGGGAVAVPPGAAVLGEPDHILAGDPQQPARDRAAEHRAGHRHGLGRGGDGTHPGTEVGAGLGARRGRGADRRDVSRDPRRGPAAPHPDRAA